MSNTNLIGTSDLAHGDLYRELGRAGDYVLTGSLDALLTDTTEDAGRTIYRQVGDGDDAYREAISTAQAR